MIPYRDVNLLCPGPSLKNAKPDLTLKTVAINCAIEFAPCDWWAVGDDKPIKVAKTLPRVGIGSKESVINELRSGKLRTLCDWNPDLLLLSFNHYPDYKKPWYTSLYALHMCRSLGAKTINIYGMDLVGKDYFMQPGYGGNFLDVRWKTEKEKLDLVFDLLQNKHGITINLNPYKEDATKAIR